LCCSNHPKRGDLGALEHGLHQEGRGNDAGNRVGIGTRRQLHLERIRLIGDGKGTGGPHFIHHGQIQEATDVIAALVVDADKGIPHARVGEVAQTRRASRKATDTALPAKFFCGAAGAVHANIELFVILGVQDLKFGADRAVPAGLHRLTDVHVLGILDSDTGLGAAGDALAAALARGGRRRTDLFLRVGGSQRAEGLVAGVALPHDPFADWAAQVAAARHVLGDHFDCQSFRRIGGTVGNGQQIARARLPTKASAAINVVLAFFLGLLAAEVDTALDRVTRLLLVLGKGTHIQAAQRRQ